MAQSSFSGEVTLTNKFGLGKALMLEHLAGTISETGRDIAQSARENMHPGWFFLTGLSQDETRWERTGELEGQVHVPTDYAANPEFGTATQPAHPVLMPAVMQHFPVSVHKHWNEASLPDAGPIVEPMAPIGHEDRTTGKGYR